MSDTLSRREFVVVSSTTLAGLMLAACAGDGATGPLTTAVTVQVAHYSALSQVGGIVRVTEASAPIALERTASTTFVAYSLICPHQGGTVAVTGNAAIPFQCPVHGAQFNADGANIGGQATSSLNRYATTYDAATNSVTISP